MQPTFNREKLCSLLGEGGSWGWYLKQKMEEPRFFVGECTYKASRAAISPKEFSVSISTDDGSFFNYNEDPGENRAGGLEKCRVSEIVLILMTRTSMY